MPNELWAIYDTQTTLWCSRYSIDPNFCMWGSAATAQIFTTKQATDNAIAAWPSGFQENKIGSNPPNPPK